MADYHFAPTSGSRENLLREGIPDDHIYIAGNTVIDALHFVLGIIRKEAPRIAGLPGKVLYDDPKRPLVLITGHRRENFGQGFESICNAIGELSNLHNETAFVYPVYFNPNVRDPVQRLLGNKENVYLIEPLSYLSFLSLMDRANLILTDSGGVQEEALSLGKPVLVMRDTTERPEVVEAGTVMLVGTDRQMIINAVSTLLDDENAYNAMANSVNPYGDGHATERILGACKQFLDGQKKAYEY